MRNRKNNLAVSYIILILTYFSCRSENVIRYGQIQEKWLIGNEFNLSLKDSIYYLIYTDSNNILTYYSKYRIEKVTDNKSLVILENIEIPKVIGIYPGKSGDEIDSTFVIFKEIAKDPFSHRNFQLKSGEMTFKSNVPGQFVVSDSLFFNGQLNLSLYNKHFKNYIFEDYLITSENDTVYIDFIKQDSIGKMKRIFPFPKLQLQILTDTSIFLNTGTNLSRELYRFPEN